MKSKSSEAGRIADVVSKYSLAYPEIKFSFSNEGKTTLRTPGNAKLLDSVISVYGLEIAQNMLEINNQIETWNGEKPAISVQGLIGSPRIARSNRDYLNIFVNRRWVNNKILSFAIEEAYQGLLMQGKHPIVVVNIGISPQQIDVNVHPAKTEIKFQDERAAFSTIQKAVRQALVHSSPVPQVEEIKPSFNIPSTPFSTLQIPDKSDDKKDLLSKPNSLTTPLISLPLLRVLGQMARNYIVAEGPDGLFLIDQHAAHERIVLENIKNQRINQKLDVQGLLEPVTFEVEPHHASVLNAHIDDLSGFGFNIEAFGDRTFLVRAIPSLLKDKNWKSLLQEAVDTLTNNWVESFATTMACHSAIRAGQILNDIEMRELIKQLEQTVLPNSCPHGRPTMIHLTTSQIEKEFGRT
jgi:DNA mismatch repair protein MutL